MAAVLLTGAGRPVVAADPQRPSLGPIILRQIELFSELGRDNEAWQKTKADIANIIKLVFKDGDRLAIVDGEGRTPVRTVKRPASAPTDQGDLF